MTCRSFILLSGLFLALTVADVAHSQTPPRRQTLADRIRGWASNDEPAAEASNSTPPTGRRVASSPRQVQVSQPAPERRGFPQIDARSLLPTNLFGGRDDEQPTTVEPPVPSSGRKLQTVPLQRAQPNHMNARPPQSVASASAPTRTAMRPRAGSAQAPNTLQDGFTLPGLGGAPLPSGAVTPVADQPRVAQAPPAANQRYPDASPGANPPNSPSTSGDHVARSITMGRSVTRPEAHVDATAPPTSLNPATGSGAGSTRQSPYVRTPLHVDADKLRRELAGAFPANTDNESPSFSSPESEDDHAELTPEPAPAAATDLPVLPSGPAQDSETALDPLPDDEMEQSWDRAQPESSDAPVTLPVVEAPVSRMKMLNIERPAPNVDDMGVQFQPREHLRTDTPTRRDGTAAFGVEQNSNDNSSELNFDFARPAAQSRPTAAPASTQPAMTPSTPTQPTGTTPSASRRRKAFGGAGQMPITDPNVLASHQTPVITTDIRGPKQILIGREATYRVRLQNQGQISAEGIIANIRIPSGADVVDTATTHGTIQQARDAQMPSGLEWQLTRLEAGASETLDVRLVPRSSRPLELGVSWTLAPVGSRAVVEVQEPKLRLHVSGPDEVLFGKSQLYRLTLTNPGTGIAENVKIDLLPPGGGDDAVTSHAVGDLPAGTSQSIEVELTAREAGKLYVKAMASADGDLSSDASKEIFCRKPELEVDWRGPETKYSGTEATHFFRVRNPGTATAENVTVTVTLPEGAELVSASEGQAFNADRREVAWRVGSLGPGDDYYMELKCLVKTSGRNLMTITAATAAGDLVDTSVAETNVIALADLKLEVIDPQGPVAVGDEAVYEIRVQNRGAGTAEAVNVIAMFSDGVEPDTVEGAMYSVADGRVSFRTIDALPAGKQVVLRIRAHAQQPGNHAFRAEVLCRDLDIKLAAEGTTRFYADDVLDRSDDTKQADQPQEPAQRPVEVGDRYQIAPK